jgi:hypothetical protein
MYLFFENNKPGLFDKGFGARIKAERFGQSMFFLVIMMAFIGSIIMIKSDFKLYNEIKDIPAALTTESPEFEFRDGRFLCDIKAPYIKRSGTAIFIIDPSGKTTEEVFHGYKSGMIISETKITYKKSSSETTSYDLSNYNKLNFTKSELIHFIDEMIIPGLIFIFIIAVIFIYIGKLFGVLFLSLFALVINQLLKTGIEFRDLFKISIYAIVIPSILNFTLNIFDLNFSYSFVLYYAIAIYFLVLYIKGYDQTNEESVEKLEIEDIETI